MKFFGVEEFFFREFGFNGSRIEFQDNYEKSCS